MDLRSSLFLKVSYQNFVCFNEIVQWLKKSENVPRIFKNSLINYSLLNN
jgi:hypothetical protein